MEAGLKTYRNVAEQKLRDDLIVSHLGYVKNILGRLLVEFPNSVDYENLEAAGILGLVEAANRFSPEKGIDFKTFAYQRIRGAVFDELRRNCPLPQHILKHWAMIRKVVQSSDDSISEVKISKQTGLSVEEVETCLSAIRMTAPVTWHEELTSKQDESHQDELEEIDRQQLLTQAIEELPKKKREIITLYHMDQLTLKQIGEVVGLSESRVSRILAQTELILKKRLQHLVISASARR